MHWVDLPCPPPRPTLVHTVKKSYFPLCVVNCQNLLQDFSALFNEAGLFSTHSVHPAWLRACVVTPRHVGSVSGCPGSPIPWRERGCGPLALAPCARPRQGVSLPLRRRWHGDCGGVRAA